MISRESVVSKKVEFILVDLGNGEQARIRKLGGLRYSTCLDWLFGYTEEQRKSLVVNREFAAKLAVAALVNEDSSYMFAEDEYALLLEQDWLFDLQAHILQYSGLVDDSVEGEKESPKGKA